MNHPLMDNNITKSDLDVLINFLKENPRLTSGSKVRELESSWSRWLSTDYSCMANSGSSANLMTMFALKEMTNKRKVILPPLTWVSDINSVLLAGFEPIFVDINLKTLALDTDKVLAAIDDDTAAVFLTHILGFNGLTNKLINTLKEKNIHLIEDCCESHGATHENQKIGSFGLASNFSFYYAHHMTTIEGGIVSTNDKEFYELCRMIRAHGMIRELEDKQKMNSIASKHPDIHPEFIFQTTGFNMRPTEINAVLGLEQIKRLDTNNSKRNEHYLYFLDKINSNFYKDFETKGMSNYAFVLMTNDSNKEYFSRVCKKLSESGIEYRRGTSGGGNQLRQPYLKDKITWSQKDFKNVEHVHNFGMYLGNYPDLSKNTLDYIIKCINEA